MLDNSRRKWWVAVAVVFGMFTSVFWADGSIAQQSQQLASGSAPAPVCTPVAADLISWWRAENNARDAIATNNGTLIGGVKFVGGVVGKAFSFNGADYVNVPNSPNLALPNFSGWTIQLWAFRSSSSWPQHLAGKRQGCGGGPFFQLAIGTGAFPPSSVPINRWVHLAVTMDGNGVQNGYVNGSLVYSYLNPAWKISNSAPFEIGRSGTCAGFVGSIDEVALYRRVLSPSEINEIYLASNKGQCVPQP